MTEPWSDNTDEVMESSVARTTAPERTRAHFVGERALVHGFGTDVFSARVEPLVQLADDSERGHSSDRRIVRTLFDLVHRSALAANMTFVAGVFAAFVAGLSVAGYRHVPAPPAAVLLVLLVASTELVWSRAARHSINRLREDALRSDGETARKQEHPRALAVRLMKESTSVLRRKTG